MPFVVRSTSSAWLSVARSPARSATSRSMIGPHPVLDLLVARQPRRHPVRDAADQRVRVVEQARQPGVLVLRPAGDHAVERLAVAVEGRHDVVVMLGVAQDVREDDVGERLAGRRAEQVHVAGRIGDVRAVDQEPGAEDAQVVVEHGRVHRRGARRGRRRASGGPPRAARPGSPTSAERLSAKSNAVRTSNAIGSAAPELTLRTGARVGAVGVAERVVGGMWVLCIELCVR